MVNGAPEASDETHKGILLTFYSGCMLTASLLIASVSPLHFQKNLFASGIMTESNATSKTPSVQQDPVVGVNEQYNGRTGEQHVEHLEDGCVLIAGGGPVGLVLATVLSYYGVKSVILERNATTTRWPKMDLTNARSMEMFRKLGLANELRKQGVPAHFPYSVKISKSLHEQEPITQWPLPGVDDYRKIIAASNDGSLPLEPYQRLSQAVFEAWLKELCDKNPDIEIRFQTKVEKAEERDDCVLTTVTDLRDHSKSLISSKLLAACDGASSKIRRGLQIELDGGPVPSYTLLIHFKSRDLTRLHRQGRFWHIFFLDEGRFRGAIIAQDEKDTWTTHLHIPMGEDCDAISSHDAVHMVLGGLDQPYSIQIDEVLVRSTYRPSIAIARSYAGAKGRIYLAGDAAHQNIPTGGYGMNMGLGDAFDLGWKMAATLHGWAGPGLLQSYEEDRRPVAMASIERSGVHNAVHGKGAELLGLRGPLAELDPASAQAVRDSVHQHYQLHDGENKDLGIEMGQRYASRICIPEGHGQAPVWEPSKYIPTTWPGSRAPHVFLKDGRPIFDLYGTWFSLVDFLPNGHGGAERLMDAAAALGVPVKHVRLAGEGHARQVWEENLVLVRPDGHVAWRGDAVSGRDDAVTILRTVTGHLDPLVHSSVDADANTTNGVKGAIKPKAFSSITNMSTQSTGYEFERMGEFQR